MPVHRCTINLNFFVHICVFVYAYAILLVSCSFIIRAFFCPFNVILILLLLFHLRQYCYVSWLTDWLLHTYIHMYSYTYKQTKDSMAACTGWWLKDLFEMFAFIAVCMCACMCGNVCGLCTRLLLSYDWASSMCIHIRIYKYLYVYVFESAAK